MKNLIAETVDRMSALRHLPTVITSVLTVDVCMRYLFSANLVPFSGDLVMAATIDAACGLLTMEPVRPTFVIFTLMRYFLHFCVLGLGFLIQICESYETSSKQKISPDQASRISNLFARKSTNDSGSGDSVRNIPKSGPRSFTDTAETSPTTFRRRSSNLCVTDSGYSQDAGTTLRPCS